MARLVAVCTITGADGAESLSVDLEPLSPQHSPLRPLARQYTYRRFLPDCGRSRSLSSTREPRGLALMSVRPRHQHQLLLCRVRHLCPACRAQLTARRRSDGMDRFLGLAYHKWPHSVLHPAVSHRKATEQALEMVGLANGDFCRSGSDSLCVLFWSAFGYSWPDPKSARDRGLHQCLQSGSLRHGSPPDHRSGLSSVYAPAPGRRGRTPADQMVRLRCCGNS